MRREGDKQNDDNCRQGGCLFQQRDFMGTRNIDREDVALDLTIHEGTPQRKKNVFFPPKRGGGAFPDFFWPSSTM